VPTITKEADKCDDAAGMVVGDFDARANAEIVESDAGNALRRFRRSHRFDHERAALHRQKTLTFLYEQGRCRER
jgi:hypothetical protein